MRRSLWKLIATATIFAATITPAWADDDSVDIKRGSNGGSANVVAVSYTHLRAHET